GLGLIPNIIEVVWLAIHQDKIDLCVRYPERFDRILHRRGAFKRMRKRLSSSWQWERDVQLGIEPKVCFLHYLLRDSDDGVPFAFGLCSISRSRSVPCQPTIVRLPFCGQLPSESA